MIWRRSRPTGEFKGGGLVRCTVCRSFLRPKRTPKGGRYVTREATATIEGKSVTYNDDRAGCWFCGSPFWDGGKAGDLMSSW